MKILVINPGATSTKIAVFEEEQQLFKLGIDHSAEELNRFERVIDQADDTDTVVQYLVTLHRGMLLEWRIYEGAFDIAARGMAMAEILLRGLEKPE